MRDIWLYSIALAQHATDVAVHLGSLVVTHHHVDVTPSRDNLPDFTRRVHHDMSCALNALLARERYDSPRELWDGRRPHYLRLMDEAAQASHLGGCNRSVRHADAHAVLASVGQTAHRNGSSLATLVAEWMRIPNTSRAPPRSISSTYSSASWC